MEKLFQLGQMSDGGLLLQTSSEAGREEVLCESQGWSSIWNKQRMEAAPARWICREQKNRAGSQVHACRSRIKTVGRANKVRLKTGNVFKAIKNRILFKDYLQEATLIAH